MKRLMILSLLALANATAVLAAPPPPPPPGRVELIANFFNSAPTKLPAENLGSWARYISPDVKVYHGDKLVFENRTSWLADLNSPTGLGGQAIGYSVAYQQFYELADEGIRVLEWAYPYGKDTVFHGIEPYRFATYYFDNKQVVRVVYDQRMAPYDLRSGKKWN